MSDYLPASERREKILTAALALAEKKGYQNVRRDEVAQKSECSTALVSHYFSTMPQLKRAIMREAIKRNLAVIVAQGLADKNPYAMKATTSLKNLALATLR